MWLHTATRVPNRNWDTPILICVIMKPDEITDREHRVKGRVGTCALNICRIWMIVMRQNRQSKEVLLNHYKYFSQFYGHSGWIINSRRIYTQLYLMILVFVVLLVPVLFWNRALTCRVSVPPSVWFPSFLCFSFPPSPVPFPRLRPPAPHPLISVYKVFVLSVCLRQIVPVSLVCFRPASSTVNVAVLQFWPHGMCSFYVPCVFIDSYFAFVLQLFCCYFVFLSLWLIVFPGFLFLFGSFSFCSPSVPSFYRWNIQCFYSFIVFTTYFLKFCWWHSHTFIFRLLLFPPLGLIKQHFW